MKKSDVIKAQITDSKTIAQAYLDEGKVQEAKAKMAEIEELNDKLNMQLELEASEAIEVENKIEEQKPQKEEAKAVDSAKVMRAIIKACTGKKLTDVENSLLPGGSSGEGYILPVDVKTKINELKRDYRSMREDVDYMRVTTLTGSYAIEDFETVSELIDFTDGTAGSEATDITFRNKTFSLKEKGALITLSNTLLAMTDNGLIDYVSRIFAKKAVITENKMIVAAYKTGKTVKALADWKALKKSINVDIDESMKYNVSIITNQDGFDVLDSALDTTGRPVLQPDPTNATQKLFMGYPVKVYSNALLPTTGTTTKKAPIFYGNMKEAIRFIDNDSYAFATSEHAGFTANTTLARAIEYIDCIQHETSDKVYCYGEVTVV